MLLGEYLAFRHSRRVLLIDMDAQANLSYCMMHPDSVRRQHQEGRTSYHNIVKHYRNTHSSVAQDIYGRYGNRYQPFDYWLPDSEQFRKIGEYEPDILSEGQWAMGMDRKFSDLTTKYGTRHQLTNPKSGPLDRSRDEGTRYRLQDRLANLVEEFQQRCM